MKRKLMSLCLCLILVISTVPCVSASEMVSDNKERIAITDISGDTYYLTYQKTETGAIVTQEDHTGFLLSKSIFVQATGEIIGIRYGSPYNSAQANSSSNILEIQHYNINDSMDKNNASLSSSNMLKTPSWTYHKEMDSEYYYLGERLAGDTYYRNLGLVDEYNTIRQTFISGSLISAIVAFFTASFDLPFKTICYSILVALGIDISIDVVLNDADIFVCVREFEWEFRCDMDYNGRTYDMCEISRPMEYVYSAELISGLDKYEYYSGYSSELAAVNAYCQQAVDFGAYAYNLKFITENEPDLPLPVNGKV